VGGQLGGAGELPRRTRQRPWSLSFERQRPGRHDAGAFAGGVRARNLIGAGGAQLYPDPLDVAASPMPHHAALLQLGTPLNLRPGRGRRPRVPLRQRTLRAFGVLAPASAQRRQREVLGEPPAAIPDHPVSPLAGAGEPDRVADHLLGAAGGVARADLQPVVAQRPHELGLGAAGGRARPHDPLQGVAAAAFGMLAAVAVIAQSARIGALLGGLDPAAAHAALARLQVAQPMALLELPAGLLGARAVVVHRGLGAVLGHQSDHQVGVV
jgi:hypothetical protein